MAACERGTLKYLFRLPSRWLDSQSGWRPEPRVKSTLTRWTAWHCHSKVNNYSEKMWRDSNTSSHGSANGARFRCRTEYKVQQCVRSFLLGSHGNAEMRIALSSSPTRSRSLRRAWLAFWKLLQLPGVSYCSSHLLRLRAHRVDTEQNWLALRRKMCPGVPNLLLPFPPSPPPLSFPAAI